MRDAIHNTSHFVLAVLRVFGPIALVMVVGAHVTARTPAASPIDENTWLQVAVVVAIWLVAEPLHAMTRDDPQYVGNCPENPTWLWRIFSS